MPARVASVPRPSVSRRILRISGSCTWRAMPVMAASRVASVNALGAWVIFSSSSPRSHDSCSPSRNAGRVPASSSSSSSTPSSAFQPALRMRRALAWNRPPAMRSNTRLSLYSNGG
ncbi:hypothetical protein D3C80_1059090 [compost metagenome]